MTRLANTASSESALFGYSENPALPQPLRGVLADALDQGATDIHIDTWGIHATVRYRIDGVPRESEPLDLDYARRLINQVKVTSNLDIEATLRPMEGQFRFQQGQHVRDIRVTIIRMPLS